MNTFNANRFVMSVSLAVMTCRFTGYCIFKSRLNLVLIMKTYLAHNNPSNSKTALITRDRTQHVSGRAYHQERKQRLLVFVLGIFTMFRCAGG